MAIEVNSQGQAAAGGQPSTSTSGMATTEPSRWISAVSSALSWLDLTSAFQPACSRAPNSTAATTGQLKLIPKAGGAVFSVGSMAYIGSLNHNGFDNDIARITTNVLRRFSDPQPFKMPPT